jgi:glutathione S-transferase
MRLKSSGQPSPQRPGRHIRFVKVLEAQESAMKIYEWNWAPNCRRLRIFLQEKGLDLPMVECISPDLSLRGSYRSEYRYAMVPMLELDDGTQIGEVLSIWHYLETLYPDPPLLGTTALEKAMISAWERRAYDEGLIGYAEISRNSHPNFVDRGLPGHRTPVPQIPALIERGKLRVAHFHRMFDEQLSRNKFVAGDKFSAADITAIAVVDFGRALGMEMPSEFSNMRRWYDDTQRIESVKKSLPNRSPDGVLLETAA